MDLKNSDGLHLDSFESDELAAPLEYDDYVSTELIFLHADEQVAGAVNLIYSVAANYLASLSKTCLALKSAPVDHMQGR